MGESGLARAKQKRNKTTRQIATKAQCAPTAPLNTLIAEQFFSSSCFYLFSIRRKLLQLVYQLSIVNSEKQELIGSEVPRFDARFCCR
jgi:hypothetical protein